MAVKTLVISGITSLGCSCHVEIYGTYDGEQFLHRMDKQELIGATGEDAKSICLHRIRAALCEGNATFTLTSFRTVLEGKTYKIWQ